MRTFLMNSYLLQIVLGLMLGAGGMLSLAKAGSLLPTPLSRAALPLLNTEDESESSMTQLRVPSFTIIPLEEAEPEGREMGRPEIQPEEEKACLAVFDKQGNLTGERVMMLLPTKPGPHATPAHRKRWREFLRDLRKHPNNRYHLSAEDFL